MRLFRQSQSYHLYEADRHHTPDTYPYHRFVCRYTSPRMLRFPSTMISRFELIMRQPLSTPSSQVRIAVDLVELDSQKADTSTSFSTCYNQITTFDPGLTSGISSSTVSTSGPQSAIDQSTTAFSTPLSSSVASSSVASSQEASISASFLTTNGITSSAFQSTSSGFSYSDSSVIITIPDTNTITTGPS